MSHFRSDKTTAFKMCTKWDNIRRADSKLNRPATNQLHIEHSPINPDSCQIRYWYTYTSRPVTL